MTNKRSKAQDAKDRLAEVLVDDVLTASDTEILAEAKEDGRDAASTAIRGRALFERALAVTGKSKMAAARSALNFKKVAGPSPAARLTPEEARKVLSKVLAAFPETAAKLTMAARKGQDLSDADVFGMLEDLAELGLLPPEAEKDPT